MRAKTFLTADTETLGLSPNNIVYDFAYSIATRKNVLLERSFLICEIFTSPAFMFKGVNNPEWANAFGGKIFSHYIPSLDKQVLRLHNWRDIIETMRDDMLTYGVSVFTAYNLNFDINALRKTNKAIYGNENNKILGYKPDLLDLWLFSCQTALNSQLYHDVANAQGWVSPANNVRTTAEKTFAFLTGDYSFIEAHTALQDVQIETEILQRLLARKKRIPYNDVQHMPWQIAQKIKGKLI